MSQIGLSREPSSRGALRHVAVPSVLVMFFLICAGSSPALLAAPISFTTTWTLSTGGPTTATATTAYTFDPTTALFTGFVVSWNTLSFDFATLMNSQPTNTRESFQQAILNPPINNVWGAAVAPHLSFFSLSFPQATITQGLFPEHGIPLTSASGRFTVTQTSVPEPTTLTLCGIGLGGLFLTRYARSKRRKRIGKFIVLGEGE